MTLKQIQFELEKKLRTMCQEKGIDIFSNKNEETGNPMFRFVDRKTGMCSEIEIQKENLDKIESEAQKVTDFYYSLFAAVKQMGAQANMSGAFKKMEEEQNGAPIDVECEVE